MKGGLDERMLAGLAPQFEAWKDANLHAALIARSGTLAYERYFPGEDMAWANKLGRVAHGPDTLHDLRSITKSVTSLVFGAVRDRGLIGDLDQPVFALFPEHADLARDGQEAITLRHLLTMTAGLAWNESVPYTNPENSEIKMIFAPDRVRFVLEQPVDRAPGAAYLYNGGLTELLSAIIARATGGTFEAAAKEYLFDPLEITGIGWNRHGDGLPSPASGLRLRARDLLAIGQLVLHKGAHLGRQVVSEAWIEESTTPHIHGEGLHFYGYQWWLGRSLVSRREFRWIAGYGNGGQRLYIVPDLDMVAMVFCGLYDHPFRQSWPGEIVLRRYAIPAALAADEALP